MKKKSSKSGEFGFFFSWKILCIGWNDIFHVKIWRKISSKRNIGVEGEGFTFLTSVSYYLKHMSLTMYISWTCFYSHANMRKSKCLLEIKSVILYIKSTGVSVCLSGQFPGIAQTFVFLFFFFFDGFCFLCQLNCPDLCLFVLFIFCFWWVLFSVLVKLFGLFFFFFDGFFFLW